MARSTRAHRRTVVVGVAIAGLLLAAGPVTATATASPGTKPQAAAARTGRAPALHADRRLGTPSPTATVTGAVALRSRDPLALTAAATAVSDPRSSRFHHYLPKGAFAATYGPAPGTVRGVEAALREEGLTVTSVSSNGLLVRFTGSVAHAEAAMHTRLATYRGPDGHLGTETTTAPAFPAAVADQVLGVVGLNTALTPQHAAAPRTGTAKSAAVAQQPGAAAVPGGPQPCAAASRTAKDQGGITFDQLAHSYGVDGLFRQSDRGAGQTIAVFEQFPYNAQDIATFDACYFGASRAADMAKRLHRIVIDGGSGSAPSPGTVEADLDIEDLSAIAPDATIEVYDTAGSVTGAIDNYNAIVTRDTASVVTTSYGYGCEDQVQALLPGYADIENQIFEQAALQGQTVFAATGDSGSDDCAANGSGAPADPTLSIGDPGNQPFVTAVGGTAMQDATQPADESVWNDGLVGGAGGGGVSGMYGAPSWQVPALSSADRAALAQGYADGAAVCPQAGNPGGLCRQTPDVSALASPNVGGLGIYDAADGGWFDIGGTSSSAPLWAAMLADVNASTGCRATSPVGFASPALYAVAANPATAGTSFTDVTAGNNDMFDLYGGRDYAALRGYDMATGLGTPQLTHADGSPGLAARLCSTSPPSRPSVSAVSPAAEPLAGGDTITVSGSGFTGAQSLSVGTVQVPSSKWTVLSDGEIRFVAPAAAAQGGGDPAGRALVSVTGVNGSTSPVRAANSLFYVDGSSGSPIPSVIGVVSFAGSLAGGNTVTVFGSGLADAGGDAVTGVTFGQVAASAFHVISPTELSATVPAFHAGTTVCATQTGESTEDCAVQVVVSNAHGASATHPILPPSFTPCPSGCETFPAPSEYDYLAAPVITSVSPTYLSEQGGSLLVVDGQGFNPMALDWVNIGPVGAAASQDEDFVSVTPTEIQVLAPGRDETRQVVSVPVTVQTEAGLSNASSARYAGAPVVTSVSPAAGSDTGGTTLTVTGKGFTGAAAVDGGALIYVSIDNPEFGNLQMSGYQVSSDRSMRATTPPTPPGTYLVTVCTVTDCSVPETESQFEHSAYVFFRPGNPRVTSVSPRHGPASGGTRVVITGHNLDNVLGVRFGGAASPQVRNAGVVGGDSYQLIVVSPPGTAGSRVPIVVTTVRSRHGGTPSPVTTAAHFRYRSSPPSPPREVHVVVHGTTVTLSWRPPASTGGFRVRGYRAVARALPGQHGRRTPHPVVVRTGRHGRTARLTGLKGGWEYAVAVRATNRRGSGPPGRAPRTYFIHQPAR